ncbi:hypothetical protein IG631_02458 [Alternaria alternata]|nr:hypothetical protein IG631_02458 [Alternaria alternata]
MRSGNRYDDSRQQPFATGSTRSVRFSEARCCENRTLGDVTAIECMRKPGRERSRNFCCLSPRYP